MAGCSLTVDKTGPCCVRPDARRPLPLPPDRIPPPLASPLSLPLLLLENDAPGTLGGAYPAELMLLLMLPPLGCRRVMRVLPGGEGCSLFSVAVMLSTLGLLLAKGESSPSGARSPSAAGVGLVEVGLC